MDVELAFKRDEYHVIAIDEQGEIIADIKIRFII
jgi:hypothetical protein